MNQRRKKFYYMAAILIVLLAAILRLIAARGLPVDFDEPVYYELAIQYAEVIRAGDLAAISAGDIITVHPLFAKLVYGLILSQMPPADSIPGLEITGGPYPLPSIIQVLALRLTAVFFGVLNVLLVALVDPIAAFFLAINSYTVKYSAQIYLEALPLLTSTLAVLAYLRSHRKLNGWLVLSAVALGLTAAGKYIYCVAGIAILLDFFWHLLLPGVGSGGTRPSVGRGLPLIFGWGFLALLTFFIFNPVLWTNPFGRLFDSLWGNVTFSQSDHVVASGLPVYQPFIWLFSSVPWHPRIIFTRFDGLVALVGLLGIPSMWRQKRVMVLWWLVGMVFLILWSTKWPQYILAVTVPVAFCAASGVRQIFTRITAWGAANTNAIKSNIP